MPTGILPVTSIYISDIHVCVLKLLKNMSMKVRLEIELDKTLLSLF